MTRLELMSILSKQWANVNDIKKIASCGRDNATRIRELIITEIEQSGKHLPRAKEKLVPMKSIIDYFNLNIEYISLMAEKEREFIGGKYEKTINR